MSFAVGVFDLFTLAIPGSLQLALFTYVAARLHWVRLEDAADLPGVVLVVAAAVLSYLLGHATYRVGDLIDRVPPWSWNRRSARRSFLARNPAARGRAYVDTDQHLLLALAELHNREVAAEVHRVRAQSFMLRNSCLALVLMAAVALVELAVGPHRVFAGACAVGLGLLAFGAGWNGQIMRRWAHIKTLEICFWIPDIDERLAPPPAPDGG